MPKRYFSTIPNQKRYTHEHYQLTSEYRSEMFILGLFKKISSIPAAFWRAIRKKKITTGFKKSQKSQGIPNNLFDDLDSFEE